MEAVARDDPGHALELPEAISVGHEGVPPAPESEEHRQGEGPHPPREPVALVRERRQSAHTEAHVQRRQHVDAVRQKHEIRYHLLSP